MNFKEKAEIMDAQAISRAVTRISFEILERNKGAEKLCLIGVRRRGAVLAQMLADKIVEIEGKKPPLGILDITLYRDDIKDKRVPAVGKTEIDFDLNGSRVILVDDVMFTGRTVRAAIDAIMDLGRPTLIQLAVLIDRGHRELPFRPDYIGKNVPTSRSEAVKVLVPEYDGCCKVVIGDCSEEV